jgi:hypothetical protein
VNNDVIYLLLLLHDDVNVVNTPQSVPGPNEIHLNLIYNGTRTTYKGPLPLLRTYA